MSNVDQNQPTIPFIQDSQNISIFHRQSKSDVESTSLFYGEQNDLSVKYNRVSFEYYENLSTCCVHLSVYFMIIYVCVSLLTDSVRDPWCVKGVQFNI